MADGAGVNASRQELRGCQAEIRGCAEGSPGEKRHGQLSMIVIVVIVIVIAAADAVVLTLGSVVVGDAVDHDSDQWCRRRWQSCDCALCW